MLTAHSGIPRDSLECGEGFGLDYRSKALPEDWGLPGFVKMCSQGVLILFNCFSAAISMGKLSQELGSQDLGQKSGKTRFLPEIVQSDKKEVPGYPWDFRHQCLLLTTLMVVRGDRHEG